MSSENSYVERSSSISVRVPSCSSSVDSSDLDRELFGNSSASASDGSASVHSISESVVNLGLYSEHETLEEYEFLNVPRQDPQSNSIESPSVQEDRVESTSTADDEQMLMDEPTESVYDTDESSSSESESIRYIPPIGHICTFCALKFKTEEDLSNHTDICSPSIKNIINIPLRQCLVCSKNLPQFSVPLLIQHSTQCLIKQRMINNQNEVAQPETENTDSLVDSESEDDVVAEEESPSTSSSTRRTHGERQITILNNFFNSQQYPNQDNKDFLVDETGLSRRQINSWFRNTRYFLKLNSIKSEEAFQDQIPKGVQNSKPSPVKPVKKTNVKKQQKSLNRTSLTPKRTTKYTEKQYDILEASFLKNPNPDKRTRILLAHSAGLTSIQVMTYMYNRKRRNRKRPQKPLRRKPTKTTSWGPQFQPRVELSSLSKTPPVENSSNKFHLLQAYHEKNNIYPNLETRKALAKISGLTQKSVDDWFYHRIYRRNSFSAKSSTKCRKISKEPKMSNINVPAPTVSVILDEATVQILEDRFKIIQYPTMMDLFDIGKSTSLRMKQIQEWFAKKRKSKARKQKKPLRNGKVIGSPRSRKYRRIKNEDLNFSKSYEKNDKVELKEMPIRRKLAALKKISVQDMEIHITECGPLLSKLFTLLCEIKSKQSKLLHALMKETDLLIPVLKLHNPFSLLQIMQMENWQSDFLKNALVLEKNWKWGLKVVQVWLPCFVYSNILKISVASAVQEIFNLSFTRNEDPILYDWMVPTILTETSNLPK